MLVCSLDSFKRLGMELNTNLLEKRPRLARRRTTPQGAAHTEGPLACIALWKTSLDPHTGQGSGVAVCLPANRSPSTLAPHHCIISRASLKSASLGQKV